MDDVFLAGDVFLALARCALRERLVREQSKRVRGLALEMRSSPSHPLPSHWLASLADGSPTLASLAQGSPTFASFADGFDCASNAENVLAV